MSRIGQEPKKRARSIDTPSAIAEPHPMCCDARHGAPARSTGHRRSRQECLFCQRVAAGEGVGGAVRERQRMGQPNLAFSKTDPFMSRL